LIPVPSRVLLAAAVVAGVAATVASAVVPGSAFVTGALVATILLVGVGLLVGLARPPESSERESLDAFTRRRLGRGSSSLKEEVRRAVTRDVGSLLSLHQLVAIESDPPPHGDWVADPETLAALVAAVRTLPDGAVILEVGGGLSTIWLGLAARAQGRGITVVSLEHDEKYATATRAAVARQRLEDVVDVRLGALEPYPGSEVPWYPLALLDGVGRVDLLFVDGPPAATSALVREPAVPAVLDRLQDGAIVVLDDTNRSDERTIVDRWTGIAGVTTLRVERRLGRATVLRADRATRGGNSGAEM
jgi:predicted O-methyltransferase YrrM